MSLPKVEVEVARSKGKTKTQKVSIQITTAISFDPLDEAEREQALASLRQIFDAAGLTEADRSHVVHEFQRQAAEVLPAVS